MKKFLITYDLLTPGKDYHELFDAIESLSGHSWHGMQNIWFVKSVRLTSGSIRDILQNHVDSNDKLFICELSDWASYNISKEGVNWLNS